MLKVFIGKDGAFTSMLKSFVEKALESEMEGLLEKEEYSKGNKRSVKG